MSRFRTGSPRKTNSDVPHYHDLDSIHEQSPLHSNEKGCSNAQNHSIVDSVSLKRLFEDSDSVSDGLEAPVQTTPDVSATTTNKTPYNMLKRLAALAADNNKQRIIHAVDLDSSNDAASYVSHTTRSIQETSALLESPRRTEQRVPTSPWTRPVARAVSPLSNRADATQAQIDHGAVDYSAPSTPLSSVNVTRGTEFAEGYISPPQSRRTSPKSKLEELPQRPVVPTIFRKISSPSPAAMRRSSTNSSLEEHPSLLPSSPRSRLTRTLIEIQRELAASREGIDDIDNRLIVLEQHSSLNPDQLQKHVQDCIQTVLVDADESSVLDPDTLQFAEASQEAAIELTHPSTPSTISARRAPWPGSFLLRTCIIGCVAALAVEYAILSLLNELGRRQNLFIS